MLTVGYGDINATNEIEALFIIFSMLISCAVFAYTLNFIGSIISDITNNKKQFQQEMIIINKFLERKGISRSLKFQIRKYLEFNRLTEKEISKDESKIFFQKLNSHLKEKVQQEINETLIKNSEKIFSQYPSEIQQSISNKFQDQYHQRDEIIFEEGELETNPSIYLIEQGSIQIFYESLKGKQTQVILKTLNKGEYFGQLEFYTEQPKIASAQACEFTQLKKISKQDFLNSILESEKGEINEKITFSPLK
ncbi:Cyclic nucleotide-binding protein [Pseudocohnilembus persalinus]|uniref:Cyclic nucleotide-binding protein n=1 Tax=Pseudocohnilembus persalinus TaxID=266149 RepID=A0A0V0R255_PSEPJ|nr:Cyclic nucleotide-binding protein [Pseudocohnilembus persalinus]|eukprot:KRX08615.1 Cyclic nucleotide-binding protein [Pseudocohnilembus persalinus]